MLDMSLQQVSMCSVLGAVLVAIVVYQMFQQNTRAAGPAPCDSCGTQGVSARQVDVGGPEAAPPPGAMPASVDPNGTEVPVASVKAGIARAAIHNARGGYMMYEAENRKPPPRTLGYETNLLDNISKSLLKTPVARSLPDPSKMPPMAGPAGF